MTPFKSAFLVSTVIFLSACSTTVPAYLTDDSERIHQEYFGTTGLAFELLLAGTEYETPVFHFTGTDPGPAVLIIGGTHGNEPAGFEAAHRLLKIFASGHLDRGSVYLIPEANKLADRRGSRSIRTPRGVNRELGNLNRCYPGNTNGLPMEQAAFQITNLIKQNGVSAVIDLHESPVFHMEYKDESGQYHGLGQTVIYTNNEEGAWISMLVVDEMNTTIPPGLEQFSLAANPVQHSAAWLAGDCFNLPGFTIETCKKLPLENRISYQIQIVDIILREIGLIGE
ncbi:MAG: succinylglutamate desuccinylase/aspartoacylase family protein [Candidatus Neomarinimicrobiota bacterium]